MNAKRIILHVDLNSFFATAEQQANPVLRGRPVGIIKAKGRGCIIAASVEAKKMGVGTGSSVFDAKKACPGIILVPADFDKYADITYRFIDICKSYSPVCEVFSLDECFIDLTQTEKFWDKLPALASLEQVAFWQMWTSLVGKRGRGVVNIAFEIKRRLREEIGDYMSCSVGISHNKLLAKLASSQIKPDGLFWITASNAIAVLDRSELTDVCGLGLGLNHHLGSLGIDNFQGLRTKSLEFLHKHFGPYWSVHLYNIARGVDQTPVIPLTEIADAKSVGRTYTTHRNLTTRAEILKLMRNLCEEAAAKARAMGLVGRYVGICLRGPSQLGGRFEVDGKTSRFGHLTLKNYIDDGKVFFDLCSQISKGWPFGNADGYYVRFCGVSLEMLTKKEYLPYPLFTSDGIRQKLIKTVDLVNSKYGDYTVYPGQLLGMPIIMPEVNGFFGDKSYRLKFVRD